MPLLSNSTNHDQWPVVIAKDVQKHVHSLKSTVYQVKGQVNGQTVLPMPVGVEKVHEVERVLIETNGEVCDLYLKSAIEAMVIKWAAQVNDVLANDSSENTSEPNPTPSAGKVCSIIMRFLQICTEFYFNRDSILEFTPKESSIYL